MRLIDHLHEIRREDRRAARRLTEIEARLDIAHLGGLREEIDRMMVREPRRLAHRWGWSLVAVRRLLARLERAPTPTAAPVQPRAVEAVAPRPVPTTGSSMVTVRMISRRRR